MVMINPLRYNREHHLHSNNLLWLLLALLGILIFPALAILFSKYARWVFDISYSLVIFSGIYIVTDSRRRLVIGTVLGVLTLLSFWANHFLAFTVLPQVLLGLMFFGYISFQLVHILLETKTISLNLVYGAMVGYMLIGIIGSQLCILLDAFQPGSFASTNHTLTAYSYIYFSFVTLTSVGYGDILPRNEAARAIAILIGIAGQMYLTIMVAILIGKYLSQAKND